MVLSMPAIALRGKTILPGMIVHFDISRGKSLQAVKESMADGQRIFLVTQKDVEKENPTADDLFAVGVIAEIKQVIKLQNDIMRLLVIGICRAQMLEMTD
ncbi:MAG: LON peptidase substrate-binding domain-containing protein, partial [Clostridiales bacterium]|nr:LON peptidase substrate-binding domain-containing protein [Clostridiales bacterium]